MAFSDYVTDLQGIRDDAKTSLDDAQAAVDRIIDGALNDFTGSDTTYADFDIGPSPVETQMPSPEPDLIIPPFDTTTLDEFDPYEVFETARYDSEFLEYLEQQCRSILIGNIPGFTNATADALFLFRQEQDQRDLQVELSESVVEWGARRGFPIPPDALAHKQNEILRRYSYQQNDRTRETTTLLAERITDMVKHAMTTGVNIEDIRSRMFTAILDGLIAKIRAEVDVYQAKIAGLVAEYEGEIKLIMTEADIARINGLLNAQYADSVIKKTIALRNIKLGIINREYDEVNTTNTLKTNSANALMEAWARIYSSASLGTQTSANEQFTG